MKNKVYFSGTDQVSAGGNSGGVANPISEVGINLIKFRKSKQRDYEKHAACTG